ncbi:MAG: L,D-transpeptidase family protein [Flammeovirgaceae bacterium]|nr:L,D-transpeptidase family protein [Flammeovirgaceae bacterium]
MLNFRVIWKQVGGKEYNIMGKILSILLLSIILQACSQVKPNQNENGFASLNQEQIKQLITVSSEGWYDFKAQMTLMEKDGTTWKEVANFKAVIGRNGFGIGRGKKEISTINLVEKKEGAGKSPAGIFSLGQLMGYSSNPEGNVRWDYRQITTNDIGIDDPASLFYNQVIDTSKVKDIDFKSFETIRRDDNQYKWLYEINHNRENISGLGSLIFLHIWKSENRGTAGCTAISEENFKILRHWLDQDKNPVIIQAPNELKTQLLKDFAQ